MAGENQRRTPRVAASQVVVKVSTKDRFRSSYLRDLSEGGLFVKTDAPLPVGREIVIDLLPPTWTEPLRLKGVVTRQDLTGTNKGMGVQFKDNDAAAVERLAGLISDYQTGTLPPPDAVPVDHKAQAEQLLEQLAAARTALERKAAELESERARREEQEQRALQLAQELGAARAHESAAPAGHAQLDEMVAELAAAHHEVSELRTRVGELEGELSAYQQEVQVLEQDDATTRQLAGTLAKEKTELSAEVQRLRAAVDAEKARAKDAIRAAEEAERGKAKDLVRAAEDAARAATAAATARATAAESELETMRLALAEAQGRVQAFEENAVQVQAHLDATAAQLAESKAAQQASAQRLKQLEASLKDEKAKAEKARTKEREVRELLAAMSSGARAAAPAPAPEPTAPEPAPAAAPPSDDDEVTFMAPGESPVELEPDTAGEPEPPPSVPPPPAEAGDPLAALDALGAEPPRPTEQALSPVPPEVAAAPAPAASIDEFAVDFDTDDDAPTQVSHVLPSFSPPAPPPATLPEPNPNEADAWDLLDSPAAPTSPNLPAAPPPRASPRPPPPMAGPLPSELMPPAPPPPPPPEPPEAPSEDLSVDIEEEPAASMSRPDFEKKLRANAVLKRTPEFSSHVPRDPTEEAVMGLMEAADRFTELMVLGRGKVTPPQLLDALHALYQAGALTFPE